MGGVECDKWVIHVNVFRELVRRWWVVSRVTSGSYMLMFSESW